MIEAIGILTGLYLLFGKPTSQAPAQGRTWPIWDPVSRDRLAGLHPVIAEKASRMIYEAERLGIRLRLIEGFRTYARQAELYAQGRTAPGRKVTNARPGESDHNFGLAFDVVEIKAGRALWNNSRWAQIAAIGKALGLQWGGDWQSIQDRPHFYSRMGKPLTYWRSKFELGRAPWTAAGADVAGIAGTAPPLRHMMKKDRITYLSREYIVHVSPWFEPYQGRRTRLGDFTNSACGVYIIRTKRSGKIRYVGYSGTNLYKTLYRHFQSWKDATQYRVEYDREKMEIMIVECACSVAQAIEQSYQIKYNPPDNREEVNPSLFKPARSLPTEDFNTTDPDSEDYVPF